MRALDYLAIETLMRNFALLNDRGDYPALAALFSANATFARPSSPEVKIVGRAAILQSFIERPKAAQRRHLVANPEIEFIAPDRAVALCYSIVITPEGNDKGSLSVGGFKDAVLRTDEGWRFESRTGFTSIAQAVFAESPLWPETAWLTPSV